MFIRILIFSLILGSVLSIGIFLFGEFGRTERRILWTIGSLGLFSLIGLCSSIIYESGADQKLHRYHRELAITGMCSASVAFLISLLAIWEVGEMDYLGKPMIILVVLGVAVAHTALLMRLRVDHHLVHRLRRVTYWMICLLAFLIVFGVIFEIFEWQEYWRIIGVIAILDVLGTILVPILHGTLPSTSTFDGQINYDDRRFRVVDTSGNSETDDSTVFHYKQQGNIVRCEYSSQTIVRGHLIGLVDQDGSIDMRYHQVNQDGTLMTGICRSRPEVNEQGKITLHEEWEWTSGDRSSGQSSLEEI